MMTDTLKSKQFNSRTAELSAPTASCLVESDPGGTQICVRSNLATPEFDFFKKIVKWGMGLGMF